MRVKKFNKASPSTDRIKKVKSKLTGFRDKLANISGRCLRSLSDVFYNSSQNLKTGVNGDSYVDVRVFRKTIVGEENGNGKKIKYGFCRQWRNEEGEKLGKEKTGAEFDSIMSFGFYDNLTYVVKKGDEQRLMDCVGNEKTKQRYDAIEEIFNGDPILDGNTIFLVKKGNKKGIINDKGEEIIEPQYDDIEVPDLWSGVSFIVKKGNKKGIINSKGEVVIEPKYDDIEVVSFGKEGMVYIVKEGNKKGIINDKGEIVIKPQFDDIIPLLQDDVPLYIGGVDVFIIRQGKEFGMISAIDGSVIVTPEYDKYKIRMDNGIVFKKNIGEKEFYGGKWDPKYFNKITPHKE